MNRKTIQSPAMFLMVLAIVFAACNSKQNDGEHQHESNPASTNATPVDTVKKSIPKEEHAQIGDAHIMIKYHAPSVRGRTIWGGLVPYGEVWVTGAHSATSIEISKDFTVGSKNIPAGKYALFTIPGNDKWTIILNKNWDQHLADEYNEGEDVVRLEVDPQTTENIQERLRYSVRQIDDDNGFVDFRWEKIQVSMPFQLK
jgi:hypothetical protein